MDIEKVQINGQRRVRRISSSTSDEGFEIFIQNLPPDSYEDELWPLLERFGEVLELRLMMNFSGMTRGFAYAKYSSQESAATAVNGLNRHEIRPGLKVSAQPSLDKKKLFVGKLPRHMNARYVAHLLHTLTANIAEVIEYGYSSGRWALIITYKTHTDAAAARRVLISNRQQIFRDDNVVIEWAQSSKKVAKKPQTKRNNFVTPPPANVNQTMSMTPQGRPLCRSYGDQPWPGPGPSTCAMFPDC